MATASGDLPTLVPSNIYMGTSLSGAVARIWPSPDPESWHVGLAGYPPQATEKPVSTERVPEQLREWGFAAERWASWPVAAQETNPDLRMLRQ